MESKTIFEAFNLRKMIEGILVLNDISFQIPSHTTIAITGKNGSGKSTFLKILAGIYKPDSGKIIRNTRKIGYVPEHFPENVRFKLKEYLLLTASFQGLSKKNIEKELLDYINVFQIEEFLDKPLKQCSKGTKQKAGIIQSLLMKPDVLLLDEPLTGLDSRSQQNFIHHLEKISNQTTILFTTHENHMIEKIACQTLMLESGKISFQQGPLKEKKRIIVKFPNNEVFKELSLVNIQYKDNIAFLTVDSEQSDQTLRVLLNNCCSVLEVREWR